MNRSLEQSIKSQVSKIADKTGRTQDHIFKEIFYEKWLYLRKNKILFLGLRNQSL